MLALSRLVIISLLASSAHAKKWEDPARGTLITKFGFDTTTLEMNIQDKQDSTVKKLNLKPNAPNKTFISLGYGIFSLSAGTANPTKPESDYLYGTSKATDFQFRFHFERWSAEFFYQDYIGYYLVNTGDIIPGFNSGAQQRILYPELKTGHHGASFTYNLNSDHFSISGAFDQTARQKESGGAWLLNASANNHMFKNPTSLVPSQIVGTYGQFENIRAGTVVTASVGGGGGYTVVYDGFFLGGIIMMNVGTQWQRLTKTDESIETLSQSGVNSHVKIGLGYNGKNGITAFTLNGDTTNIRIKNAEMNMNTLQFTLNLGWRWEGMNIRLLD